MASRSTFPPKSRAASQPSPPKRSKTGYCPSERGARCGECPFQNARGPVPPEGNRRPSLVVIAESPGSLELFKGRPMVGETGVKVEAYMRRLGVPRSRAWITSAVLCQPTDPGRMKEAAACCKPRLDAEIAALGGEAPVAVMGSAALHITGLTMLSPGSYSGRYAVGMPHPTAAFFRHPEKNLPLFQVGMHRVVKQERFEWPELIIQPTRRALAALRRMQAPVSVDLEVSNGDVLAIGISDGTVAVSVPWHSYNAGEHGHVVGMVESIRKTDIAIAAEIRRLINGQGIIAHNGAFDIAELEAAGFTPGGLADDSLYAHAIIWPQLLHNLEAVMLQRFAADPWKRDFKVRKDEKVAEWWRFVDPLALRLYNAKDSVAPARLMPWLRKRLAAKHEGEKLYRWLCEEAIRMGRCYRQGVMVDVQEQQRQADKLKRDMHRLANAAYKYFGYINLNSKAQLAAAYKKMGAKVVATTTTGQMKLDEKVLAYYKRSSNQDIAKASALLEDYRSVVKLKGSFVDNLFLDVKDYCHPQCKPFAALSGRYGYTEPAINTTPPELRRMFRARPGHTIIAPDLGQAELRLIGLYAGDAVLLDVYNRGGDLHRFFASRVFECLESEVQGWQRKLTKPVNFNIAYSSFNRKIAVESLWAKLKVVSPGISLKLVASIYDQWFSTFHRVAAFRHEAHEAAKANRYVREPFSGRQREFLGPVWKIKETEVINFLPQSGTAYVMHHAIEKIERHFERLGARLLFQVHDEAVIEVANEHVAEACTMLRREMPMKLELGGLAVEMEIGVKLGPSWGHMWEDSAGDSSKWETKFSGVGVCVARGSEGWTLSASASRGDTSKKIVTVLDASNAWEAQREASKIIGLSLRACQGEWEACGVNVQRAFVDTKVCYQRAAVAR